MMSAGEDPNQIMVSRYVGWFFRTRYKMLQRFDVVTFSQIVHCHCNAPLYKIKARGQQHNFTTHPLSPWHRRGSLSVKAKYRHPTIFKYDNNVELFGKWVNSVLIKTFFFSFQQGKKNINNLVIVHWSASNWCCFVFSGVQQAPRVNTDVCVCVCLQVCCLAVKSLLIICLYCFLLHVYKASARFFPSVVHTLVFFWTLSWSFIQLWFTWYWS